MNSNKTSPLRGLNAQDAQDRIVLEIGRVITAARAQPKKQVFSYTLSQLPEHALRQVLEGMAPSRSKDEEHPSHVASVLLAIFLRSQLHGDKQGGVSATDDEMVDIVNTLQPYFVLELLRRRDCFGVIQFSYSPWLYNAELRVRQPRRDKITSAVAELEALGVPYPPLLTDEPLLDRMESADMGVVLAMPPCGRPVASEDMLQLQPHKLPELDPKRFSDACREVNDVGLSDEPMEVPDVPDVDFIDKSGETHRLPRGDNPVVRAVVIFNRHFNDSQAEAQSALVRFTALMNLLRGQVLSEWVEKTSERTAIHPAIMVAAATVKLTKGGLFPPAQFTREVARIAQESRQEED